jgi:hypothetical protein
LLLQRFGNIGSSSFRDMLQVLRRLLATLALPASLIDAVGGVGGE